jgi:formamidopyrimidine-DNA glycosylase
MPEGPEVRQIVDLLNKKLKNKEIKKIDILGGRYSKNTLKKPDFTKLNGLIIESINCYGKFIYWKFKNNDIVLFNTLGMSGWWVFDEMPHNNIKFIIDNINIYFNDPRNFGTFIISNQINLNKKILLLGADIFNINNLDLFIERLNKKRDDLMICTVLLDQNIIAGCGNYLRAEALYIAKISPFRTIKNLLNDEINMLWDILVQLAWFYYNEDKGRKLNIIKNHRLKYNLSAQHKKSGPSKYKPDEGYL